jgi:hypothetical protein
MSSPRWLAFTFSLAVTLPLAFSAVPAGTESVIVRFAPGNMAAHVRRAEAAGAKLYRRLDLIQSASFQIPPGERDRLAHLPGVLDVSDEAIVKQTLYDVTPAVGATTAQASGWTGKNHWRGDY